MPPFKVTYTDSDPSSLLLREWIQPLINKYTSTTTTIRPPVKNIINVREQSRNHEIGVNNIVKVWQLNKLYRYTLYGVVRDSINLQLSCI